MIRFVHKLTVLRLLKVWNMVMAPCIPGYHEQPDQGYIPVYRFVKQRSNQSMRPGGLGSPAKDWNTLRKTRFR
jgi:hypothetical protein